MGIVIINELKRTICLLLLNIINTHHPSQHATQESPKKETRVESMMSSTVKIRRAQNKGVVGEILKGWSY